MTGFKVNPAALDAYAKVVGDPNAGGSSIDYKYLIDAGKYADANVKLEEGGGGLIFKAIVGKTNDVHQQVIADNSTISTTLVESANGLIKSAQEYRSHDFASAQKIDSIYKPGGVTATDFQIDDSAAPVDPASKLLAPSSEGAVPDMVQQILDGAGYFSESDLVLKILGWCGLDVKAWVMERFLGNFGEIAKVKNAIEHLGEFDEVAATDIVEGADVMCKSWSGNGADAAKSYFDQLANALEGRSAALKQLASKYNDVLVGIQQLGSAIEGGITGAIDAALEAAAAVAAAGCLQEVPGLDVLMDIIGAWRVTKVFDEVHKVISIWNIAWSSSEGFMGATAGLAGILGSYNVAAKVPKMGYYNSSQGSAPNYNDNTDRRHGPQ
jgi:uncharacterized protein YukE